MSENYIAGGLPPCIYIYGHSGGLLGSRPYSPWVARVLGRSGLSGLAVKVLAQNVRDVGLNPTCSSFSQLDV